LAIVVVAVVGIGVGALAATGQEHSFGSESGSATRPCSEAGGVIDCPEGPNHIVQIRFGGRFGCAEVYSSTEFEIPMFCQTGVTASSQNPAGIAAYDREGDITSTCPPLLGDADGNAGPLFCRDGRVNPSAVDYYKSAGLSALLALGPSTTLRSVESTLCGPVLRQGTFQIALEAYALASRIEGWGFPLTARSEIVLFERC
jgi:hypothetical protein